jgi:hypothetical protein
MPTNDDAHTRREVGVAVSAPAGRPPLAEPRPPDPPPVGPKVLVPALRCAEGTPPLGWEFLGSTATAAAYVVPCPCCLHGWVALVPDGRPFGYRIAFELGCGEGCPPELVAWWHAWRNGDLPAEEPAEPTPRARAYARAAAVAEIRSLAAPAARRDPRRAMRDVAFRIGRILEPGGQPADDVAGALLLAGEALGVESVEAAALARQAVLAGMARPRELPR